MEVISAVLATVLATVVLGIGTLLVRTMMRGLKTYLDDEIRSKLVPNGGKSLADRVERIETAVDRLTALYEEQTCPNPGCPQRTECAHTQAANRRRGFLGLRG